MMNLVDFRFEVSHSFVARLVLCVFERKGSRMDRAILTYAGHIQFNLSLLCEVLYEEMKRC